MSWGTDISAEALRLARELSTKYPNITYAQQDMLVDSGREAHFDLIVLADTLYYIEPLTDARLKAVADSLSTTLAPGGLLLLVNHYFFGMDVSSKGTRQIHDAFRWATRLERVAEYRRAFFLATVFARSKL